MTIASANYTAHYQRRRDQEQRRREYYDLGQIRAQEAADYLKNRFDVETVWLFGSMLNADDVYLESDIDLAVKGLDLDRYCEALGNLMIDIKEFSLDLVRIESASDSLKRVIHEQGQVL
ncbi:MAG: nucleotidyltransferase domain-containing protein [Cyanobacteria bacterium P01_H01_bin.26]